MTTTTTTRRNCCISLPMILACFAGICGALAMDTVDLVFGIFVTKINSEFPTWSRTEISSALAWFAAASSLASPPVGMLLDYFGPTSVTAISLLFMAAGFAILSQAMSIPVIYVAYMMNGLGYAGCANLGPGKIVGTLFPGKMKGRVMGIITAFNNICGIIVLQLTNQIVQVYTWQICSTVFSFGLILLAISFSIVFYLYYDLCVSAVKLKSDQDVVKEESQQEGRIEIMGTQTEQDEEEEKQQQEQIVVIEKVSSMKEIVFSFVFLFTMLGMMGAYYTYTGILSMWVPAVVSKNMPEEEAANVLAFVTLLGLCGKLICGRVSEIISATRTMQICMFSQSIGLLLFILINKNNFPSTRGLIWISSGIYGLSLGGVAALLPLVVLETFGNETFGRVYGFLLFLFMLPSVAGPIVAGWSFDLTQGYELAFIICIIVFLCGIVFLQLARHFLHLSKQTVKIIEFIEQV